MVILHTETLKKWGGQQNRVLGEAVGLAERNHRVVVACHRGSVLAGKARQAGLRVHEVEMVKQYYLSTIPRLVRIIRQEGVGLVVTHSSVDSWAGGIAARIAGRKLVRFRHNLYPIGRDPLSRLIYRLPDRLVAISDAVREAMTGYGVGGERITVIPSSVDTGRFSPAAGDLRTELGIPAGTAVVGNTSSFTAVKGQTCLLRAFNDIADRHDSVLLFAARSDERTRARSLHHVKTDLQERVRFLGHREDIPNVLRTIDIFVFPSTVEALGTSLLEAMAMELPVVVSDIPSLRGFVRDGENGLLFRPEDPVDLAEKVTLLLSDPGLARRIGHAARRTILERFTFERMIDDTERLYREILEGA